MKNYWIGAMGLWLCACQLPDNSYTPPPPAATDVATLLAPRIISSALPEFATTVSADGREIFFNRTTADRSSMQIFSSRWIDQHWTLPEPLPFSTGEYRDVDPFLTTDGERLYFSSDRPSVQSEGTFNHWYVDRTTSGWSSPLLLPAPLNSDSAEIYITQTNEGTAYFRTERWGSRDLARSQWHDGAYQPPEKLYFTLDGDTVFANNPCIAADESFIIVMAMRPDRERDVDLYISWNQNSSWSPLQNLGPKVNSPYTDFAPSLSKDGRTLYFTSERPGVVPQLADSTARPPGDLYHVALDQVIPGFLTDSRAEAVSFITPDGVQLYGDLYTQKKKSPTLLLLHQGGANARAEYAPIIPTLLEQGYNILALDQRSGGDRFGYYNRTRAQQGQNAGYCEAYTDLEAGLAYLQERGFKKVAVWGSSFSGTLAIQLAAKHPKDLIGALAFSPASGDPMADCVPDPYLPQVGIPLLVMRPRSELAYDHVLAQHNYIDSLGLHTQYIAENGVHGSSMLVPDRVGGDTQAHWEVVLEFLASLE